MPRIPSRVFKTYAEPPRSPGLQLREQAGWSRTEGIAELLRLGSPPDAADPDSGETALHIAARRGNVEIIRLLLRAGAKVDLLTNTHSTPLHLAALEGRAEAARELLAAGANVNATANSGLTPLHWAAGSGNPLLVRLLLEAGATIGARDMAGMTPLDRALFNERTEAAKLLCAGVPAPEEPKAPVIASPGFTLSFKL